MKNTLRSLAVISMLTAGALGSKAQTMYGLTSTNQVFWMADAKLPSSINGPYDINGMASGQTMTAITFNSYNGKLYGLGYNAVSTKGQLYTLVMDSSSGTKKFNATAVASSASSMDLGLGNGTGFSYMPTYYSTSSSSASGRFNIVGANGNSYILNAADGSIASSSTTSPSYASGDLHSGTSAVFGTTAYSNNYYGSEAAAQLGYDMTNGSIIKWDSSNYGTIHTLSNLALTLGIGSAVSMDSWYDTATHSNHMYMVATGLTGTSSLYEINEETGSITSTIGVIGTGSGSWNTRSIAFERKHNVSGTISGQMMYGLGLNTGNLISWDSYNPGIIRNDMPITGMTSGQTMMAIAFSSYDRNLYGLGYNGSSKTYQIYQINTGTGNATAVNSTPSSLDLGNTNNGHIAFNFNPVNNRWHIIGTSSTNSNINVEMDNTGAVTYTDSSVAYATGDANSGASATIGAIAYTNSYRNTKTSEMYGIDYKTGTFIKFRSGSNSTMNTVLNINTLLSGALSLSSNNNGFMDTYYDSTTSSTMGYLASNGYGYDNGTINYSTLYSVNLATGATTRIGSIGPGTPVKTMAARKDYSGNNATYVNTLANNTDNNLFVYPNPVTSQARIVLPNPATAKVNVDVVDMNGRLVLSYEFEPGSYNLDLDMSTLPVGLYSAMVSQIGAGMQNVKIVKH